MRGNASPTSCWKPTSSCSSTDAAERRAPPRPALVPQASPPASSGGVSPPGASVGALLCAPHQPQRVPRHGGVRVHQPPRVGVAAAAGLRHSRAPVGYESLRSRRPALLRGLPRTAHPKRLTRTRCAERQTTVISQRHCPRRTQLNLSNRFRLPAPAQRAKDNSPALECWDGGGEVSGACGGLESRL